MVQVHAALAAGTVDRDERNTAITQRRCDRVIRGGFEENRPINIEAIDRIAVAFRRSEHEDIAREQGCSRASHRQLGEEPQL